MITGGTRKTLLALAGGLLIMPASLQAHQSGNKNGHHRHPHEANATVVAPATNLNHGTTVYRARPYGQGVQTGRSVNNAYGNITIWSSQPNSGYNTSPARTTSSPSVHNMPVEAAGKESVYKKSSTPIRRDRD